MATRQTRRQLQFTGFEMAMIAASFVVSVTAVFFLGLFVGKKNASFHAPTEDRVARIPVDDFTKYKRPEPIARAPKAAPPAAAETAAGDASPAAKAESTQPAAVAAKGAVASPATQPPAAGAVAKAPAVDAAKPAAPATGAADAADAAKVAKAREAAALKEKEKEKAKEEEPATGRGYTVQILATRKQADADSLVQKLKSRGYAAYIKKVSDGAGAWYRVRVGSYGAFGEARGMADKCRRDLGLGQAFVSTE